jgi:hypothetical protein
MSFSDAMNPQSASRLSAFAGVVIVASLFGQTLTHLHRPGPKNDDGDLNGEFWKAHREIDNILLNTSLCLPSHLRLPAGSWDSNIIFLNMSLQAATICVHQAAMFKAEKLKLAEAIIAESSMRCITAATEIASIMRMIASRDLSTVRDLPLDCRVRFITENSLTSIHRSAFTSPLAYSLALIKISLVTAGRDRLLDSWLMR